MKRIHFFALITISMTLLGLSACTAPSLGLFYSLEREIPIVDVNKGIPKTSTIKKIFAFDGKWYFQGTTLFSCPEPTVGSKIALGAYSRIGLPDGYTRVLASAVQGTHLYVTLRKNDTYGIYDFDGTSWTALTIPPTVANTSYNPWDLISSGSGPVLLVYANLNENGFVNCKLLTISNGSINNSYTTLNSVGNTDAITSQPRFALLLGGTYNLFASNGMRYSAGSMTAANWALDANQPAARTYTSSIVIGSEMVLLSRDGIIARSTGAAWTDSPQVNLLSKVAYFTDIADISLSDGVNPAYTKVLASTDNMGLVELDLSGVGTGVVFSQTNGNYHSTDIYQKSIYCLASNGEQLLVGTENQGLWSAFQYANPAGMSYYPGLVWTHE